jgi:hypothetical protein
MRPCGSLGFRNPVRDGVVDELDPVVAFDHDHPVRHLDHADPVADGAVRPLRTAVVPDEPAAATVEERRTVRLVHPGNDSH